MKKEAKNIDNEIALEKKVKELVNIFCKMGQSTQTVHMLTKLQVFYDNNLKQALGFQNPFYLKKAQQITPMIYDGSVIAKETNAISIADSEETLMLEDESRSKMLLKQSDPKIAEDFLVKRFLSHNKKLLNNKLSDYKLHTLILTQSASSPVKIEAPQELPISQDIVNIVVNSLMDINTSVNVNYSVAMNDSVNYVEMCNKSELLAKDTTIEKLKANIKRLNKTSTTNNVKKDIDEIQTINIELEHMVTKLIAESEHLKQTYKQLYDSIKPSRVQFKEHAESLVSQLNQKKFKGKDIVDNAAQVLNDTTIAPGMYKLDRVTLAPKDKNNREAHIYYLKHTMEQAAILREIVKQAKSLNPLDSASYSAYK
ncbi:hypothetical protein Tco_0393516 [Tanacetum coccineum]